MSPMLMAYEKALYLLSIFFLYAEIAVLVMSWEYYKISFWNRYMFVQSLLSCTLNSNNQCSKTRTKILPKTWI